ncbi:hypothetical protein EJB05_45574, partial [Eragrostis curvula]
MVMAGFSLWDRARTCGNQRMQEACREACRGKASDRPQPFALELCVRSLVGRAFDQLKACKICKQARLTIGAGRNSNMGHISCAISRSMDRVLRSKRLGRDPVMNGPHTVGVEGGTRRWPQRTREIGKEEEGWLPSRTRPQRLATENLCHFPHALPQGFELAASGRETESEGSERWATAAAV